MHVFTEKPGDLLSADAHKIIKHRYEVAAKYSQDKSVLEVGVGQAIGSQRIAKVASSYVGGEYSTENIDLIRNKGLNQNFIQVNAHYLPFHDNSFDLVLALAMVYYLKFDIFINEVKRILKPNGKLLFCTSNGNVPGFIPAPFTTEYYSIPELNRKLNKHGFQCKFYGAFPRFNKYVVIVKLKVFIRDAIKLIIRFIHNGDKIWIYYKNKSLGGLVALPNRVEEIEYDDYRNQHFAMLADNEINEQYRVIYCVAQR